MNIPYSTRKELIQSLGLLHARTLIILREFPLSQLAHAQYIGISEKTFHDFIKDPYVRSTQYRILKLIENYVLLREAQAESMRTIRKNFYGNALQDKNKDAK